MRYAKIVVNETQGFVMLIQSKYITLLCTHNHSLTVLHIGLTSMFSNRFVVAFLLSVKIRFNMLLCSLAQKRKQPPSLAILIVFVCQKMDFTCIQRNAPEGHGTQYLMR